jgi:hypothetical protein
MRSSSMSSRWDLATNDLPCLWDAQTAILVYPINRGRYSRESQIRSEFIRPPADGTHPARNRGTETESTRKCRTGGPTTGRPFRPLAPSIVPPGIGGRKTTGSPRTSDVSTKLDSPLSRPVSDRLAPRNRGTEKKLAAVNHGRSRTIKPDDATRELARNTSSQSLRAPRTQKHGRNHRGWQSENRRDSRNPSPASGQP